MSTTDDRIAETLLEMARNGDDEAGFCPADAARALQPEDWKPLMDRVRVVASRLQRDGLIRVTQQGKAVDALDAKGPVRFSRAVH